MSIAQPELEIDGSSIVVTLASLNPQLSDAAGQAGYVMSAFGTADTIVDFRSVTIETPEVYRERNGLA